MVLEGSVDYEYGDEQFVLEAGGCVYEDGTIEHTLNNSGSQSAKVLVVYSTSHQK